MNHPFSHSPQALRPLVGIAWLTHLRRRIADAMADRRHHAAYRRDLQRLDEHTLRDIGLSHRAAAEWPQARRGDPP